MSGNKKYSLIELLRYRFNLDEDKAEESSIIESVKKSVEFKGINLWTLIFAILIASIGLNVNSTAVIIGAMLISPLMGPIMGIGLGLGIFDFALIKTAFKNLFVAVGISLLASTLYFFITPLQEARSELLARTTPTIWDVLIALFGGLAGIVASSRKNISNAIPGVAIATALMPPLCTAGYGLGTGNFYFFMGAFYLFLINCVFISLSTFLIVRFLKFKPVELLNEKRESNVRKYIWSIVILTILPSIFLAYRFVGQEIFKQRVQVYITKEIKDKNLLIMDKTIDAGKRKVVLVVYGEDLSDSVCAEIISKKDGYDLGNADILIKQTLSNHKEEALDTQLAEATEMQTRLFEKDKKIEELLAKIKAEKSKNIDSSIYKEFSALFGSPKELLITRAQIYEESKKSDTVTLIYYKDYKGSTLLNHAQLEGWLKVRVGAKNVKIIKDH